MQTHDFFSRMVALNAAGPNLRATSPGEDDPSVNLVYVCSMCDSRHDSEWFAKRCCPPEVLERYVCPVCDGVHSEKADAEDCCGSAGSGARQPMQCPLCLQGADSFEIAADCCLHTHPTMTALGRWRVAELVEGGTPWAEAIESEKTH